MLRTAHATLLVCLVLASGCAAARQEAPSALPAAALPHGPCLPPGVSDEFFSWPVIGFRSVAVPLADGTTTRGAWVLYQQGEEAVVALWSKKDLLAIDPSPRTDAPFWVDLAVVSDDGTTLRTERVSGCQWQKHGQQHASGMQPKGVSMAVALQRR
jgi:hypothetical protein